jgi:hypothetical protein
MDYIHEILVAKNLVGNLYNRFTHGERTHR